MKHYQKSTLANFLAIIAIVGTAALFYFGKLVPATANAEEKLGGLANQIPAEVGYSPEISTLLKKMNMSVADTPKNISNNLSTSQINPEIRDLLQKNNLRPAQYQSQAPDFELRDLDGKVVHLSQFRGETVLLGFFTTW